MAIINNKWVRGLYSWFGENSAPESKIAWLDIDRTAIKFFQNKSWCAVETHVRIGGGCF